MKSKLLSRSALAFVIWFGLIFATSSTIVTAPELYALVEYFTGASQQSIERFAIFWGISWFAIVKGWHSTEFAILLILAVSVVRWWKGHVTKRDIVFCMIGCIGLAISDEFHQSFVPKRMGTVMDVLIDSAGITTAGAFLIWRLSRNHASQEGMHD